MLEKIRQIAHNPLFKIFFFILAVIFAISLGDFDRSKDITTVATVGNEKISLNEFSQARQYALKQISQQQELSPEQVQMEFNAIGRNVLNQLISKSLIKQELDYLGIKISSDTIVEYVQKDSSFHKDGSFDPETYKKILEYNNLSEETLLKNVSTELSSKFLLNSLTANLPIKEVLSDYLYDYLSEKRSISLITVDASKTNYKNFSQDESLDYYKKHPQLFQTKEYRSFSYLLLEEKNLKESAKLTEEDLEQDFKINKENYVFAESRDFYHFLTPSQDIADQIINSLNQDSDHLQVAKNFIDKKVISEKFMNQTQESFLNNLDPSLFTLEENKTTKAIKSDLGWHVFKITKIHPKKYKSFSEAKSEIKSILLNKIIQTQLYELSRQVEDDLSSGATYQEIANRYNLKLTQVKNIAIDGSYLNNLDKSAVNPQILYTAFQTALQQDSPITELEGSLNLFTLKLEDITPPKAENFENVKEQVNDLLSKQFKDKIALEIANALQIELSKTNQELILANQDSLNESALNKAISPILSKYKIKRNNTPLISMKNQDVVRSFFSHDKNLSEAFLNKIFDLEFKKTCLPQTLGDAKYGFALLNKIFTEKEKNSDLYKQINSISQDNYKNEIQTQYIEYLRNKYNVEVNLNLLKNN